MVRDKAGQKKMGDKEEEGNNWIRTSLDVDMYSFSVWKYIQMPNLFVLPLPIQDPQHGPIWVWFCFQTGSHYVFANLEQDPASISQLLGVQALTSIPGWTCFILCETRACFVLQVGHKLQSLPQSPGDKGGGVAAARCCCGYSRCECSLCGI